MKTRIIQTRFWDDDFIVEASQATKYLYIYLLTSQYINISGIFQLHDKKIMMETGMSQKELEEGKKSLTDAGKVLFSGGWVFVVNAEKNNRYKNSPDNVTAYEREISLVPQKVLSYFQDVSSSKDVDSTVDSLVDGTVDSLVDSTKKSEIRNKKSEIRNREREYEGERNIIHPELVGEISKIDFSNFSDLTDSVLQEIAEKYGVPIGFVEDRKMDMEVWIGKSKKNRYANYKLALMKWVRDEKKQLVLRAGFRRGGVVDARG